MTNCAVPGCKENGCHMFPKDKKLKKLWAEAIRRPKLAKSQSLYLRLCGHHFTKSDYKTVKSSTGFNLIRRKLKENVVPSVFPWSKVLPPFAAAREERIRHRNLKKELFPKECSDCSYNDTEVPETSNNLNLSIMSHTHCAIQGCKISIFNKPIGVSFYSCPTSNEMRNRWLHALRNKCALLDWSRSRICSKHFEHKYIDSQRRLKDNAIPTLFPINNKIQKNENPQKSKIDRLLNRLTQSELIADIKNSIKRVKEPANLDSMVTEDLKSKIDATNEAQLWLIIKKQEHLNSRLLDNVVQNKKQVDLLQKNMEQSKSSKQDMDQNMETYKYIVKCLQEKLATLEEQIEILTAVESR